MDTQKSFVVVGYIGRIANGVVRFHILETSCTERMLEININAYKALPYYHPQLKYKLQVRVSGWTKMPKMMTEVFMHKVLEIRDISIRSPGGMTRNDLGMQAILQTSRLSEEKICRCLDKIPKNKRWKEYDKTLENYMNKRRLSEGFNLVRIQVQQALAVYKLDSTYLFLLRYFSESFLGRMSAGMRTRLHSYIRSGPISASSLCFPHYFTHHVFPNFILKNEDEDNDTKDAAVNGGHSAHRYFLSQSTVEFQSNQGDIKFFLSLYDGPEYNGNFPYWNFGLWQKFCEDQKFVVEKSLELEIYHAIAFNIFFERKMLYNGSIMNSCLYAQRSLENMHKIKKTLAIMPNREAGIPFLVKNGIWAYVRDDNPTVVIHPMYLRYQFEIQDMLRKIKEVHWCDLQKKRYDDNYFSYILKWLSVLFREKHRVLLVTCTEESLRTLCSLLGINYYPHHFITNSDNTLVMASVVTLEDRDIRSYVKARGSGISALFVEKAQKLTICQFLSALRCFPYEIGVFMGDSSLCYPDYVMHGPGCPFGQGDDICPDHAVRHSEYSTDESIPSKFMQRKRVLESLKSDSAKKAKKTEEEEEEDRPHAKKSKEEPLAKKIDSADDSQQLGNKDFFIRSAGIQIMPKKNVAMVASLQEDPNAETIFGSMLRDREGTRFDEAKYIDSSDAIKSIFMMQQTLKSLGFAYTFMCSNGTAQQQISELITTANKKEFNFGAVFENRRYLVRRVGLLGNLKHTYLLDVDGVRWNPLPKDAKRANFVKYNIYKLLMNTVQQSSMDAHSDREFYVNSAYDRLDDGYAEIVRTYSGRLVHSIIFFVTPDTTAAELMESLKYCTHRFIVLYNSSTVSFAKIKEQSSFDAPVQKTVREISRLK